MNAHYLISSVSLYQIFLEVFCSYLVIGEQKYYQLIYFRNFLLFIIFRFSLIDSVIDFSLAIPFQQY